VVSTSQDPITGAPRFADSDAPDPAVNPTEVAAYAAWRGNRIIDTRAARLAFAFERPGLQWYESDTDQLMEYTPDGWVRAGFPDIGIINGTSQIFLPDGTSTIILFQTQDRVRGVTPYLNPGLYGVTIVNPGYYRVGAYALWDSSSAGRRDLQIRVNNALRYLDRNDASVASPAVPQNIVVNLYLEEGDIVSAWGVQTSGASLAMTTRMLSVEELI
jgi:hypothetical protein